MRSAADTGAGDTRTQGAAATGTETVLLAEDDELARAAAKTILARAGYRVLEASSVTEALDVAARHAEPIDLLLTDVVMAQGGGVQLAQHLAPLRPRMRVLWMSGFADHAVVRHGVLDAGDIFLQKPITPDTLLRKVRQALGGT